MDWGYIQNVLPLYGKAAWLTLRTGAAGILLAAIVGLLCAAASHWRVPVLRRITSAYVEISRNTPLLIQLFFIYYGLPKIGIRTRPEACGNYLLHDLPMCKWECARYLERLKNDFHSEYTKLQITLQDGKTFADA